MLPTLADRPWMVNTWLFVAMSTSLKPCKRLALVMVYGVSSVALAKTAVGAPVTGSFTAARLKLRVC